jgi:EAL domain-containing protein (putative c-di-GMP-specific phosphodiesterase class I)/GGDEF domain-containing protein
MGRKVQQVRFSQAAGTLHSAAGKPDVGEHIIDSAQTPVFILSFRHRDELAQLAAEAGWRVVAARRAEGATARLRASGAPVAVVDARRALREGLAATAELGGMIAASGGALLVLLSRRDLGSLPEFYDAGATHFVTGPHAGAQFGQALRFAGRHAERMGGDWRPERGEDPLGWRWSPGEPVRLTAGLAERLNISREIAPRSAMRLVPPVGRRELFGALRRLGDSGATALAHELPPIGRIVQHLQREASALAALIEPIGTAADATLRAIERGLCDLPDARRWLGDRLGNDGPVGAMLVALTRFDIINAAYGRAAGDQLLRIAARRIEEASGEMADMIIARAGGAEFLLGAVASPDRLETVATRLARALARPFALDGATAVIGSRIALTTREPGDAADDMLRRAREALATAKASDTSVVRVSTASDASGEALAIDLHHGIERSEIDVLFQPQVSLASGAIVGVEALARWDHPRLGMLGADTLFAAAERADLGAALSDHIQSLALRRATAWPASLAGLRLAINVTAGDVARPDFASRFLARVAASGFPVDRLTVELTETGLVENLDMAATLFGTLRAAGCRVAIDDFGTGYSSLAYLKALPLDYLKLDRALAGDIAGSPRDRIVVRAVIEMARMLNLRTIAEGVETLDQRELLAAEECDIYQGYLCAGAVDTPALVRLVAAGGAW